MAETVFLELKHAETLPESEKASLQEQRTRAMLKYAYDNCSYYKQLFDKHNFDVNNFGNFSKLPFLTKNIIKKCGNDIISRTAKKFFLVKRNTGGSTGEPLEFYSDANACAIDLAHHRFLYHIMGYEPGDAIAGGSGIAVPMHYRNKNVYWLKRARNSVWWHICFSALYLDLETIKFYIEELLKVKPSILRGYPSFWDTIAEYILTNNIRIDFKVKGVNLTAEMCSDSQRDLIERAFKSRVFFEYGQSELTLFCYTNRQAYTYQTSPFYGYVEVVKDNGEYAQCGEEGEVIATSLCNRGMPFIRYKTGDRVVVHSRQGGMIRFNYFYGRTQDYVFDKNNQKIPLTALIFGQHFTAFRNIIRWQLQQDEIGKVIIKIVKGHSYTEKDEREIAKKIKDSADIYLTFKHVNNIPLNNKGKFLFLIQNCR